MYIGKALDYGAVAQSAERATPDEEVPGSIGWVGVSIM